MNAWRNIITQPNDPEIIKIDELEKSLGPLSDEVKKVRELITRFEVCHFKYRQHLAHIRQAIRELKTGIDPEKIGADHLGNAPDACQRDKTGRSQLGQKYVDELKGWLAGKANKKLGEKAPEKEHLVKLLIARLLYDWKAYEELQGVTSISVTPEEAAKDLKIQACSMDICHYSFPKNLDQLLEGIGKLRLEKGVPGCGSFNPQIRAYVEKEFKRLGDQLPALIASDKLRAWLTACLAKTLKEQAGLKPPIALG